MGPGGARGTLTRLGAALAIVVAGLPVGTGPAAADPPATTLPSATGATAVGPAAAHPTVLTAPAVVAEPAVLSDPAVVAGPAAVAGPAVVGTGRLARSASLARQPGGPPQPGIPQPGVVFVEVSPSVVQVGYLVGIRAGCRDNTVPAIVWSDAFGRVTVHPQGGYLTATPMVPLRTRPGNYRAKLECRDGEHASTTLQVVKQMPPTHPTRQPTRHPTHKPSRGPATGFGGTAGTGFGDLLVPGGLALTVVGAVAGVVALRRPRRGRRWWGPS
ncbi:hypothetical protein [Micromonospora rosaria]|uniref:hypothetical protein n=1 Tax=Micromonospora rosaria TaxID=47874 RepID=UPI0008363195|nr:hypothetical protein [Micromonospora rosaria]